MARKFFYVCAGMFLLALSYHLGARNAAAQGGSAGRLDCAGVESNNWVTVVVNRMMTVCFNGTMQPYAYPIPGTGRILACNTGCVLLDTGEVYAKRTGDAAAPWELLCTFSFDQPTTALHESWGQLKSRYATPPGTPGVKVTPGASER
jgi:hypothetical protein